MQPKPIDIDSPVEAVILPLKLIPLLSQIPMVSMKGVSDGVYGAIAIAINKFIYFLI